MLLWVVAITAATAPALFSGDGVVKIWTGDPACPVGPANAFVDCGNGTVADFQTGLVWLRNADCIGDVDWQTAVQFAAGLSDLTGVMQDCGLTDGSAPGEWRLPSIREFIRLTLSARNLSCTPDLSNDAGDACWSEGPGSSFTGVSASQYWTAEISMRYTDTRAFQWNLLPDGGWSLSDRNNLLKVWPVRGPASPR